MTQHHNNTAPPPPAILYRFRQGRCLGQATKQDYQTTQAYWHCNSDATHRTGVLFIHGFTSSPASMIELCRAVEPAAYITHIPLLPGHGPLSDRMHATTHLEWEEHIETAYQKLKNQCDRVIVVGQSMGGSLALRLAEKHPDISHLNLLVPAVFPPFLLNYHRGIARICRLFGITHLRARTGDIKNKDGYEISIKRIPIEIYAQLNTCIELARKASASITTPTTLFATHHDHVLPPSGFKKLHHLLPATQKSLVWLDQSYHCLSIDNDKAIIIDHLLEQL